MKKYRKAVFFTLFLFTSLGLLVYRMEYLKLRYTFELGGLLNPPALPTNCLVLNDSVSSKHQDFYLFSQPTHNWLKVNDFSVYSAFAQTADNKKTAVALGVSNKEVECDKYKCNVWVNLRGSKFSISGTFFCRSVNLNNADSFVFESFCEVETDIEGLPYMFVFVDESNSKFNVPIHYKPNADLTNSSALCIYPDSNAIEDQSIIEFISYHQLIGFTDLIVYDDYIHHGLFSALQRVLPNINFLRSFSVLPWNFPLNDMNLSYDLIKRDCLRRTNGHVKLLGFSEWSDYIIPVQQMLVLPSINKLDDGKSVLLEVPTKKCCLDSKDDSQADKSWPTIFKKTTCLPRNQNVSFILNPRLELKSVSSVSIKISDLYINMYIPCDPDYNIIKDNTALKFLTNLMSSKLLRLWRSGTIFQ